MNDEFTTIDLLDILFGIGVWQPDETRQTDDCERKATLRHSILIVNEVLDLVRSD